jgi:hypothetical protein
MDIADFNALHMPALERNEVRHNLLMGLMQPSLDPTDEMRRWTLGGAGACAIQTNVNRSIVLDAPQATMTITALINAHGVPTRRAVRSAIC